VARVDGPWAWTLREGKRKGQSCPGCLMERSGVANAVDVW
jgi:hypothetical protein